MTISRRTFIVSGLAAGGALGVWAVARRLDDGDAAGAFAATTPGAVALNAWVKIVPDGTVVCGVHRAEMGQGVTTALPMLLAEELDVDFARVGIEQAPTDAEIYSHGTGGSTSVRTSFEPLRQAAAAARHQLVATAAERWGVAAGACRVDDGVVIGPGGERAGYGELVAAASQRPLPDLATLPLKPASGWQVLGTSVPRRDIPPKLDGSARFGLDVRRPGMLYAVVARCPTIGGKPKRWDAQRAKAVKGVREVLEIPAVRDNGVFSTGGVAVVAEHTWAAISGRDALAIEWDAGAAAGESSAALSRQMEELLGREGKVVRDDGDAPAALARAARRIEATYEIPFQAHAPMEPLNATVDVRADGVEVWLGSQGPHDVRARIAAVTGVDPAKVTVHNLFLGGAFGRRYSTDHPVEAAQISKAIGRPVQLLWTREDDMRHDFYRPAARHRLVAGLDGEDRPIAWHHRMASPSIAAYWGWGGGSRPEMSEIGGAVDLPYALPAHRMEYALAQTAVPVMWWRSVEHSGNAFVIESFVDELAHAAGVDPLEFRLRLLAEPREVREPGDPSGPPLLTARLRRVLELAAEKAGWGRPLAAGRARGIAAHFSFHSYVAEVAEVSLERGRPRVHRVVAAVDCGQVMHPDNLAAQVEGGVVYGLTATLKGAITVASGQVEQSNFHDFEMLRIDEMPVVEVHAVASEERPTGIGEPALPPIAPAVANALFALTGKRLRRLPISPSDLA